LPIDAAARVACCHEVDAGQADVVAAAPRESANVEAKAASPLDERFVLREGCAKDLRVKGMLEPKVAELGRLCAQGMNAFGDVARAAGSAETTFAVSSRAVCIRVGAVANAGELSLTVSGPHGETLATVRSSDPVSVLPSDGPLCVREAGVYHAKARLGANATDNAETVLQVWRTGREP
jgi:hypothetical protein